MTIDVKNVHPVEMTSSVTCLNYSNIRVRHFFFSFSVLSMTKSGTV